MCQPKESQSQSATRGTLIIFVAIESRDSIGMAGRSRMNREVHVRSL